MYFSAFCDFKFQGNDCLADFVYLQVEVTGNQLLQSQAPRRPSSGKGGGGGSQQNYEDLYGNPDKRSENIILRKKFSIKKPTLIAIVSPFLPECFSYFPDSTRFKP